MFAAALGRSCPARAISGPVISAVSVGHGDQPLPGEGGAGLCWSPDSRGTALVSAPRDGHLGETEQPKRSGEKALPKMQFGARSSACRAEEICSSKRGASLPLFNPLPACFPLPRGCFLLLPLGCTGLLGPCPSGCSTERAGIHPLQPGRA